MRGKLLFVAGLATGYVLGARAGRPAYEAITTRVQELRENPTVQKVGGKAKDAISDAAPGVAATVSKAAETTAAAAAAAGSAGEDSSSTSTSDGGSAPTPSPKPGASPKAPNSTKTEGAANSSGAASGAEDSSAPGSVG